MSSVFRVPVAAGLSRRRVLGIAAAAPLIPRLARAAVVPAPKFPKDFVWGVATAAYQIEGAAAEEGRGPSVWDTFSHKPGATFDGQTGDVACDHYHRYREDVGLLRRLGVRGYRFSISWSRVLPQGRGTVNQKGVDFYKRLLDELHGAGIEPLCTLYHWDLPAALSDQGGWQARDCASWFADYATLCARAFGDRIARWVTLNEPQVHIALGYMGGSHAPGLKLPTAQWVMAAHNLMRGHGLAVRALRAAAPARSTPVEVGYVVSTMARHPATDSPEDVMAARTAMFRAGGNPWNNTWWLDPVVLGRYPEDGLRGFGADAPKVPSADLDDIKAPIDFLGLNIYTSEPRRRGPDGLPVPVKLRPGYPIGGTDWQPLVPQCLYWAPKFINERYKLPIVISEHGMANRDAVFLDGAVHDPVRVDFTRRCLLELGRALGEGVPVRGYYHWSFLDNYEWADGYRPRFGLVFVDYQSLRRVPKDSFTWYRQVIASNGRNLGGPTAVPVDVVTAD